MGDTESTIAFETEGLPTFTVGKPYEEQLVASGGTESYNFTIESGEFPSGIGLSGDGYVSGTPSEGTEDTTFFITVTDYDDNSTTQAFDCEVRTPKGEG